MPEAVDIATVARGIRRRATLARWSATAILLLLTMIGVTTAYFFIEGTNSPLFSIGAQSDLKYAQVTADFGGIAWISELTRAFVKIGAVIMSVFIVNILVSFSRYSMRVANYLDSRADCLIITNGDTTAFATLLPILSVDPLDFVATPMNPYDGYLETFRSIFPGGKSTLGTQSEKLAGHQPAQKS